MLVVFKLSMPNVGSWNGKWTGAENLYAVIRNVTADQCTAIDGKSFYYNFGDGWGASVSARRVANQRESRSIRKDSKGFCGYEWMIDSIIAHGKIQTEAEQVTA